jgi:D-sedoheptulose 7-phosphate isomerase
MENQIKEYISESIKVKNLLLNKIEVMKDITEVIYSSLKNGKKIIIAGNGGSAADSQHFAAELIGRYKLERRSLPAIALNTDTSILTAIGNDYGFEEIYRRQIESLGEEGDIFVSISTSGNSENLVRAIKEANNKKMKTISLLGKGGGVMKDISNYSLIVPSDNIPRIQETHIFIIHTICEIIEKKLFKNESD